MCHHAGVSGPVDPSAATFGLPPSLRIPIAAEDVGAIERFVGPVVATLTGRSGRLDAVKVRTAFRPDESDRAPLWGHPDAARFRAALFPPFQLWVHVDYASYRSAWHQLHMPAPGTGQVLDHVANRRATRTRGYLHPYVRLAPISGAVNTNAGHRAGGEGMERAYMEHVQSLPAAERSALLDRMRSRIVYADPMDITKMLDVSPGTQTLEGVRDFQQLLYPG